MPSVPNNRMGPHSTPKAPRAIVAGICASLVTLVFIVFGQTAGFGFINYDDPEYIGTPIVSKGLSIAGIRWAFTHVHANNWHPLTTIFHMLDCQAYGLWAGGHHLTNAILHAICAVLLFLMLLELTGALWRCAFVAALFAIHPLRVESVAWVAELKDLLSGIFFMLTLWAYARYARRPARGRYAWVAAALALGLLSKPMLVTTPFVLLLLDYWPLARLQARARWTPLLIEKLPLFALSALSCAATIIAQTRAIHLMEPYPLSLRIGNALVAYAIYNGKMIYPSSLAVIYPILRDGWPLWQVIAAIVLLISLTAAAFILRRSHPYLLVGWLWYLGMLVPVIGILQVGEQAYADRYTYLPQIGLAIAGTWTAADWSRRSPRRRLFLAIAAPLYLCILMLAAWHQTTCWRDSITLWEHTLDSTHGNYVARNNLGTALVRAGRLDEAADQFAISTQINPDYAMARGNLGHYYFLKGRMDDAAAQFRQALRIDPSDPEAHSRLAAVLVKQGRMDDAAEQFREILRIDPTDTATETNLGAVLQHQGHTVEAAAILREAVARQPGLANAHFNLGNALLDLRQPHEAIIEFSKALALDPQNPTFQDGLAQAIKAAQPAHN